MQKHIKTPVSSKKLQTYVHRSINMFKQEGQLLEQKNDSKFKEHLLKRIVRTSLQKSNKASRINLVRNHAEQFKTIPFKNNAITQKLMDNFFEDKESDKNKPKDLSFKAIQGLKPLFKIKKTLLHRKKSLKDLSEELQLSQSLNASFIKNKSKPKSLFKESIETSFHKSYKNSMQIKKIRYKQKQKSNPEEYDYFKLLNRIKNTTLLGKHILKNLNISN